MLHFTVISFMHCPPFLGNICSTHSLTHTHTLSLSHLSLSAIAKVYPICTIRSTPAEPVHCIVWAKELFKLLLGPTAESMLFEAALYPSEEEEGQGERGTHRQADPSDQDRSVTAYSDTSEYMKYVTFPTVQTSATLSGYVKSLFVALFHTEVAKQVEAGVYKTSKKTPQPLHSQLIEQVCEACAPLLDDMLAGRAPSGASRSRGRYGWIVYIYPADCINN